MNLNEKTYDDMIEVMHQLRTTSHQMNDGLQNAAMGIIGLLYSAKRERSEWLKTQPPPDWFGELLDALEWQGGTMHGALNCVRRLVVEAKEREAKGGAA